MEIITNLTHCIRGELKASVEQLACPCSVSPEISAEAMVSGGGEDWRFQGIRRFVGVLNLPVRCPV